MENESIYTRLDLVQKKLKCLLDKHSALQKENNKLLSENESIKHQLAVKDAQLKAMEQQMVIAKSGIKSWHSEQKKLFVKRIDLYVKEIDKCLALLNR